MKDVLAHTKNLKKFLAMVSRLETRPHGLEGIGVLWGIPGEGKTRTIAYSAIRFNAVYVEATDLWSVNSMLRTLCVETRVPPRNQNNPMFEDIVQSLAAKPRPIFVDEADKLLSDPRKMEVLRSIYDKTKVPLVFIGMENMERSIMKMPQLARRVTQWLEFRGTDWEDTQLLAKTVCDIPPDDALLEKIWKAADKNMARIVNSLAKVEAFGKNNNMTQVSLNAFGKTHLFYDEDEFRRPTNAG